MKRRTTTTSSFGTKGRIGHDASRFYGSKLYEGIAETSEKVADDNVLDQGLLDRILLKSAEQMDDLPDNSIHLVITSPPYNVTKEYDQDLSLTEYRAFLQRVFKEVFRVLVHGGRACVNVANLGRKPYIPLHAFIIEDMTAMGFLMRGEIIWDKGASASPSTAWGSWQSASNPTLRDVHEYILVFSKGQFNREKEEKTDSIGRDEFLEYTKSVWTFPAERATKVGHPAPFPRELPERLIKLYSFEHDIVLDPFCGSGTTCLAARASNRHYIGYEVKEEYLHLAERRLETESRPASR